MKQGDTEKHLISANGVSARDALNAVKTLIQYMGENPDRNGLLETPDRVCRSLLEMASGYQSDPKSILSTTFHSDTDEMIVLKDIDFTSLCEHHMLVFHGKAHVGYIPQNNCIVGLSKLARVVDAFANRLQVQERMTYEIAKSILENLNPEGVGVVIEGVHSCMCVRGVKKHGATMVTSAMLGSFRDCQATRSEFMHLIGR